MNEQHKATNEQTVAVEKRSGIDGEREVVLTIENAIEDRVRTYSRLMKMRHVLRQSRTKTD